MIGLRDFPHITLLVGHLIFRQAVIKSITMTKEKIKSGAHYDDLWCDPLRSFLAPGFSRFDFLGKGKLS